MKASSNACRMLRLGGCGVYSAVAREHLVHRLRITCFSMLLFALVCANAEGVSAAEVSASEVLVGGVDFSRDIKFSRDIRPILADRCFVCHGPDKKAREADLRLDIRVQAIQSAMVPGDSEASELVRRISSNDPEQQMPPANSHRARLDPQQIALVRRWIDEGATYDQHWAFRSPMRSEPPEVQGGEIRNEIDRFIIAGLSNEELEPSRAADRRTLLRRLSFDLLGLPPTPAEVERFVADRSAVAYEREIDRLLNSAHFGERMAMYWLDVVRYADTNGIHGDNFRPHSSYRDWVIKAFNQNLPYDQFVIEQLAGDLLPINDFEQQIASGFNRLNMTTREGGAQPKEYQVIYQADRVRNTSAIFLGITMGCAQCHDHKFDPITMRDFYSWGAFFADLEETPVGTQNPITLPCVRHNPEDTMLDHRVEAQRQMLTTSTPQLVAAQIEWEKHLDHSPGVWRLLEPASQVSQAGATLVAQDDGSVELAAGEAPDRDEYTFDFKSNLPSITALYLEAMPDPLSPAGGPGRAPNGNFVLSELEVRVDGQPVKLRNATATFSQIGYQVEGAIDAKQETGWAILPKVKQAHHAVFEIADLPAGSGDRAIRIVMKQSYGGAHVLGRFRWWATNAPPPVDAKKALALQSVARTLTIAPEARTSQQRAELSAYYRTFAPLLAEARTKLAELLEQQEKIGGRRAVLVSSRLEKSRMVRILSRGNWMDESGEVVQPDIPAVFGTLNTGDRHANRLDLARWIVSPENPLSSRVQVNRLWKIVFGRGLAIPLDDFGAQGRIPLHPELLDWLATEFVRSGWDTKKMLKLLVTSAAYRRSAIAAADGRERDPENDYYARQNRFRLDAEMVRDNALAISGLLNTTLGGESAKPYQPAGYWAHLNFPNRKYAHDTNTNQYRRGLYTYWCRTFLHPSLRAFDAPSREECTVDRPRSNTPLAALVLLNDPTYVEAARVLADQILEQVEGRRARIEFAYQRALQRTPRANEVELLSELLDQQIQAYASDTEKAKSLQSVGLSQQREEQIVLRAAWTAVTRTILNLHEMITRN